MKRILFAILLFPSLAHAATLNSCGFETCDSAQATLTSGDETTTIQSTTVLSEVSSLKALNTTGSHTAYAVIGDSGGANLNVSEAWFTFKFRVHTLPAGSSEPFFQVVDTAGSDIFQMRVLSDGTIRARYIGNTAGDDSSAGEIVADTTYTMGVHLKISATVGIVQIQKGGVDKVNSTSVNTGTVNIGKARLGKSVNANSNSVEAYYDDYVVDGAAFGTYSSCGGGGGTGGGAGGLMNLNNVSGGSQ